MANTLDKVIEDLKKANGGKEDEIIEALILKRDELGDEASEDEVMKVISDILTSRIDEIVKEEEPIEISEEAQEYMKKTAEVVKEYLDENDWHYSERSIRNDLVLYELGFNIQSVSVRIRIHVEYNPNVCRIEAILPITADPKYEYPLCSELARANYKIRFGSFKHDERDGELTFEYSFLVGHGIIKDDFDTYFHAVVGSAVSEYEKIKKCCVGRFKSREINEILRKINELVNDISE